MLRVPPNLLAVVSKQYRGGSGAMRSAVYNLPIPKMMNPAARAAHGLNRVLPILIFSAGLSGQALDWSKAEQQFAKQIAAVTGPGAVAVRQENRSSLSKKDADAANSRLQADLEALAQNLLLKFPNVKLAYFSNHHYAGYSAGIPSIPNPEPFTFESGFANKWAIQDQLDGDPALNFDPALGAVLAPWMSWGPYYWANGMIPGTGGLVWTCQDLKDDGLHPSIPAGAEKAANQILNFFKTDDTTVPWFLAP